MRIADRVITNNYYVFFLSFFRTLFLITTNVSSIRVGQNSRLNKSFRTIKLQKREVFKFK